MQANAVMACRTLVEVRLEAVCGVWIDLSDAKWGFVNIMLLVNCRNLCM